MEGSRGNGQELAGTDRFVSETRGRPIYTDTIMRVLQVGFSTALRYLRSQPQIFVVSVIRVVTAFCFFCRVGVGGQTYNDISVKLFICFILLRFLSRRGKKYLRQNLPHKEEQDRLLLRLQKRRTRCSWNLRFKYQTQTRVPPTTRIQECQCIQVSIWFMKQGTLCVNRRVKNLLP